MSSQLGGGEGRRSELHSCSSESKGKGGSPGTYALAPPALSLSLSLRPVRQRDVLSAGSPQFWRCAICLSGLGLVQLQELSPSRVFSMLLCSVVIERVGLEELVLLPRRDGRVLTFGVSFAAPGSEVIAPVGRSYFF